jgi:hypothetical protein
MGLKALCRRLTGGPGRGQSPRAALAVEQLETRDCPSVTASFANGILTVNGDNNSNFINVGDFNNDGKADVALAGGELVPIQGGAPQKSQITLLVIDGKGGDDTLRIDQSLNTLKNGVLAYAPPSKILGGDGNDRILVLDGGIVGGVAGLTRQADGSFKVTGQVVGNSEMHGGSGNDFMQSGFGNDKMYGEDGDDTYVWPPGTLTDVWDGGAGFDTVRIIGNDGANDAFFLALKGNHLQFNRTNLVQFQVDIFNTERVELNPGTGNDTITASGDLSKARLNQLVLNGGDGTDTADLRNYVNQAFTSLQLNSVETVRR